MIMMVDMIIKYKDNLMDELKLKNERQIMNMGLGICLGAFVYGYDAVCLTELAHLMRQ